MNDAITMLRWREHPDAEAMAGGVAGALRDAIEAAVGERNLAILALAGGRTPWLAYERLAEQDLPWDHIIILPTDDRMVAYGDPLSNVTALTEIFDPLGARVISLTAERPDDHVAAGENANARLRQLPWPLDFVLLGVGGDGHTASIFPGPDYAAASDPHNPARALGVLPNPLPPEAPVARVSLSLAAIVAARTVAIAATGTHKRAVIEQAIAESEDAHAPIGRVLAAMPSPVQLHWAPQ